MLLLYESGLELELELENCLFDKYKYNHTTNLARNTIL